MGWDILSYLSPWGKKRTEDSGGADSKRRRRTGEGDIDSASERNCSDVGTSTEKRAEDQPNIAHYPLKDQPRKAAQQKPEIQSAGFLAMRRPISQPSMPPMQPPMCQLEAANLGSRLVTLKAEMGLDGDAAAAIPRGSACQTLDPLPFAWAPPSKQIQGIIAGRGGSSGHADIAFGRGSSASLSSADGHDLQPTQLRPLLGSTPVAFGREPLESDGLHRLLASRGDREAGLSTSGRIGEAVGGPSAGYLAPRERRAGAAILGGMRAAQPPRWASGRPKVGVMIHPLDSRTIGLHIFLLLIYNVTFFGSPPIPSHLLNFTQFHTLFPYHYYPL